MCSNYFKLLIGCVCKSCVHARIVFFTYTPTMPKKFNLYTLIPPEPHHGINYY